MYKLSIYISGAKVELFEDETVQLESSVQNIKDISKVFTDFTESFTVPASKNNNKIFKHWYNSDIINGFDSSLLVDAEVQLNGITYKTGKVKLNSVSLKDNKAQNYKIQFFGKLINLNDLFDEDLLSELDLTAYSHAYDGANVKSGLQGTLLGGDVIYPLISSSRNWDYNTNVIENEIKYTNSLGGGIAFNELKPAIKINRIIEAIETKYGVTFSSDFFKKDNEIEELFMWLNGTESGNIGSNYLTVDYDAGDDTNVNLTTNIGTFRAYNSRRSNDRIYWKHKITVTPSLAYTGSDYTVKVYDGDNVLFEQQYYSYGLFSNYSVSEFDIDSDGSPDETIYNLRVEVSSDEEFAFTTSWFQLEYIASVGTYTYTTTSSEQTISSELSITNNLPNMKVTDFFTSLVKMFNLVIDPITSTSFRLLPLDNWYGAGVVSDITKYIDVESADIKRPELYKTINFKYQKAEDILGNQFYETNKVGYGDLEYEREVSGGKLEIELKFQNLMMERLTDTTTGSLTSIHVGSSFDKNEKEILLEPVLFFNRGITNTTDVFGFIDEGDTATPITSYLNVGQESSTTIDSTYSLNFGLEFSSWNLVSESNSLYNVFWKDYITDLYDPRRREYEYKAYLPLSVINSLKLNDLIIINKKNYIINSLNIDLNTGLVKLKLLNYIGDALLYKLADPITATAIANLQGNSSLYALLTQYSKLNAVAQLYGASNTTFNATQYATLLANASLIGSSSVKFISHLDENITECTIVVCSAFETDITARTFVAYFDLPYNFTFTEIIGTCVTAPTGANIIADINVDGATILTTNKVVIEVSETSSLTATTQPTITDATHLKGQRVSIDIDQIGSTIAGQDLEIQLIGYKQ